ncbi:uncharacterized protein L203_103812 [Cryptococcus depauperatus CBS 7841]|uniref:Uncharacterized protein n=1 Tax=Cryptococcus depauperatus CBS 7841 TaxID=1295531 RepID=A0AAJ8JUG2_9TREE
MLRSGAYRLWDNNKNQVYSRQPRSALAIPSHISLQNKASCFLSNPTSNPICHKAEPSCVMATQLTLGSAVLETQLLSCSLPHAIRHLPLLMLFHNQAITFQHLQEVESVGNQLSEDFAAFVNVYNASKSNWALRYKHRKTNRRSATTSLYSIIEAVLDRVNDPYQWVHVKFDNEQDFCRAVDALAPKDSLFTEARMMNTEKNISLSSVCLQVIF